MKIFVLFLIANSVFANFPTSFQEYNLVSKKVEKFQSNKDKNRVLIFLSSTCPCSRNYFEYLNKLSHKYQKSTQFIGFHSSKFIKDDKASKYIDKFKFDFPVYADRSLKYADKLKALKTPHIFVLGKSGKVLFQGAVADSRDPSRAKEFYLNDALKSLSQNKEIKNKYARALGCYIER